ncbi:ABC transporter permease [Paenarthrobacter sp. DKR-5]|uniref:ABC transporter permease n=1 Tax=Paenarthrobacter sp. DKR-5 TaxID=2835535 RepID=UPI001BDC1992|nr:ABC transporter permease subunit [Paenarthrobacter sp. DKR-5]MBT1004004.1 ABC transporter permease [Paenarthrobacter sp. DKR-5]
MSPALVVAAHELRSARRDTTVLLVLALFLGMTLLAGVIGYTSSNAVDTTYRLSSDLLHGAVPANPFDTVSRLSLQRNLPIYFFLLGSLLAVVLGSGTGIADRHSRTVALLLSRPVSRTCWAAGKMLAVQAGLAACLAAALAATLFLCLLVPALALSWAQTGRLALFFAFSYLYLSLFAQAGLIAGMRARSRAAALLGPVAFWVITGFVIPQLSTAAEPTATLNPAALTAAAPAAGITGTLHSILGPLNIAAAYKQVSSGLLEYGPLTSPGPLLQAHGIALAVMTAAALGAAALALQAARRTPAAEALR